MTDVAVPPARDSGTERRSLEGRIVEAALRCFGRWGVTKTTVDDIARDAGISRATVYRAFPNGRDSILDAVVDRQRDQFFDTLARVVTASSGLEELLTNGMSQAWRELAGDEVLAFLLEHEPEVVLRNLAFERLESLIALCREVLTPYLAQWLCSERASRLAEWATRVVVSYAVAPPDWIGAPPSSGSASGETIEEWADELAAAVVPTFFLPVLRCWEGGSGEDAPRGSGAIALRGAGEPSPPDGQGGRVPTEPGTAPNDVLPVSYPQTTLHEVPHG